MNFEIADAPPALTAILRESDRTGFTMASEPRTGSLLRALAASKPGGRFLELGTGTGVGSSWLLAGMDAESKLDSVDNDPEVSQIARRHLGHDRRVRFHSVDGGEFLAGAAAQRFDLIYADAWAGKFTHVDQALAILAAGGFYVIDDLLPQPNWPEGHGNKVTALVEDLERRPDFTALKLMWASGLMILVRRARPPLGPGQDSVLDETS
jgi:predicted O-methyltransferase YrrM